MQSGGNKVSDRHASMGFSLTQLLCGSHYQLGFLYEVLLGIRPRELVPDCDETYMIEKSSFAIEKEDVRRYV